jgi:DNA-binding IclR family transcriptional regulator
MITTLPRHAKHVRADLSRAGRAPAVERALDILEILAAHRDGLTLTELSEALELPKNAVFRITGILLARDYLWRTETGRRFLLTPKLLALSQPGPVDRPLSEVALPAMRRLRDATGETVQLGARSGHEGVVIEVLEGLFPLRISVDRGLRFKLHNNAPGKVLLTFTPPVERETLLESVELTPSTPRTIVNRRELRRECERVADRGYATDHAEADEGIHCVAAPVLHRHGGLLAVVWVSGPSRRLPRDEFPKTGRLVRQAAQEISEELRL